MKHLSLFAALLALTPALAHARPGERTPLAEFDDNVARGGEFRPGELMIKSGAGVSRDDITALARKLGCTYHHQVGLRPLHFVRCEGGALRAHLSRWQDATGVAWVEAGFYDELEAVPNDLFELQWYHDNNGQTVDMVAGIPGADMRSSEAWDVTAGSPSRIVAIIDVGLYPDHLDLIPNLWVNTDEICNNNIDDDNNGYVDDCRGYDVGDSDSNPSPLTMPEVRTDGSSCLRWHATYIAGLAGAAGNNNLGLAGTAWSVGLMNIKRHEDSTCRSTTTRTVEAIAYAMDNGAGALGMSFSSSSYSSSFEDALQEAEQRGLIAVMSAGNGGENINNDTRYPNNYALQNKIIVASTDNRDLLDPGSNYGSIRVDVAAPGTYVVSTAIDHAQAYGVGTGTSMSVGFVLGGIALLQTAYPQLSSTAVRAALIQGGRYLSNLDCNFTTRCVQSGRRLDLLGALARASTSFPPRLVAGGLTLYEQGNGDGRFGPGERVTVGVNVQNSGTGAAYAVTSRLSVTGGTAIQIPTPSKTVGTIPAGGSTMPNGVNTPEFQIAPNCTQDASASLLLTFTDRYGTDWTLPFTADVRCAGATPFDGGTPPAPDSGVSGPDDAGFQVRDSGVHPLADSGVSSDPDAGIGPLVDSGIVPPLPLPTVPRESGCTAVQGSDALTLWLLAAALLAASPRRRRT